MKQPVKIKHAEARRDADLMALDLYEVGRIATLRLAFALVGSPREGATR